MSGTEPVADGSESPCIGVCELDGDKRFCIGCGRTLEDIGAWQQMPDEARRSACQTAAERKAAYEAGEKPPS